MLGQGGVDRDVWTGGGGSVNRGCTSPGIYVTAVVCGTECSSE